jgi:hypothetical protein
MVEEFRSWVLNIEMRRWIVLDDVMVWVGVGVEVGVEVEDVG